MLSRTKNHTRTQQYKNTGSFFAPKPLAYSIAFFTSETTGTYVRYCIFYRTRFDFPPKRPHVLKLVFFGRTDNKIVCSSRVGTSSSSGSAVAPRQAHTRSANATLGRP